MIDIKKIKELFVETPVFDDRNKDFLSSDRIFSTKKGKFVKTEKVNQELEADIYDVTHYDYYSIMVRKNQNVIGMMEIDYTINEKVPFPRMMAVAIKPIYRGKGYSKVLYDWVVDKFGGIISDESLTGEDGHGSFNLWQYLSKKYPTYIFRAAQSIIIPIKGMVTPDLMDNKNDRFMCTKVPFDYESYNKQSANKAVVPKYIKNQQGKLSETPQFNDKDKELGDDPDNFETPHHSKLVGTYPVKMGNGNGSINLYQFKSNPSSKAITLDTPDAQTIGSMYFDAPIDSDVPFPTITFSTIRQDFRGKGLSRLLYDFVISKYKGVISDATLTGEKGAGSFQVWQSLAKRYKTYLIDTMNGKVTPVKGFEKTMMGNHAERFMVSLHPFDVKQHNAKFGFNEVELMQHKGQSDIDSSDPNEWDFVSGQKLIEKKVAPGIIFLKMKIAHANDVKYALKDVKTGKIISGMRAKIDPSDYKVAPTEAQISSVVTGEQYRNKGWGKLLYKLVLDAEKTIVSDYQLYPGAAAIWSKYLPTIANVYNYNEDGELEPFDFAKGTSKEGIYDYFVASKKKLL